MDQHADKEYYKDVAVGMYDLRYKLEVPLAANATDHVAGSLPSQLVSLGGRKIGTAAEKETCEGDKCESEENIPRPFESGFQARAIKLVAQWIDKEIAQGRTNKDDAAPYNSQVEDWERPNDIDKEKEGEERFGDDNTCPGQHGFPTFVYEYSRSVEGSPCDKIETGAMPQASKEHGIHIVDIAAILNAMAWKDEVNGKKDAQRGDNKYRDPQGLRHKGYNDKHAAKYEVRGQSGTIFAAEGNVEVILEPIAERDMPAFPEAGSIGGLVRGIEVLGKVKTHEHRYANGYIGVAREIGINLQRIDKECRKILESSEKQRVFKNPVDKIDGEIVAEDDFLDETVENPKNGYAKLSTTEKIWLVELRNELVGTNYGASNKLREKGSVETKVKHIVGMANLALIDIDDITDVLESEE